MLTVQGSRLAWDVTITNSKNGGLRFSMGWPNVYAFLGLKEDDVCTFHVTITNIRNSGLRFQSMQQPNNKTELKHFALIDAMWFEKLLVHNHWLGTDVRSMSFMLLGYYLVAFVTINCIY